MKLEPVMDGVTADISGAQPMAEGPSPAARRLRRLDACAALVALAATGGFLANVLLLQAPPAGAPLPQARPSGAIQALDRGRTSHTTVPLPPHVPGSGESADGRQVASGTPEGALGYLSIRTTVTGTAAPLVPATSAAPANRARTASVSEPPPPRPPAAFGGGDVTGAVRPPADVPVSPRVLGVQKALAKLGYGPLKVDGRPSAETRSAIQRFQRDRSLPADGDISARLTRELSAVSGVAVN